MGKTRYVYQSPWVSLRQDEVEARGKRWWYHVIERADAVVVVPLSPGGRTILVKQYRYPIQSESWEFPMGAIDRGEEAVDAARRELKEETGMRDGQLKLIGTFHPFPGLSPQRVSVFIVHISDDELTAATQAPKVDDIREIISLPLRQVKQKIVQGEITDGFTITSAFFFSSSVKEEISGQQ